MRSAGFRIHSPNLSPATGPSWPRLSPSTTQAPDHRRQIHGRPRSVIHCGRHRGSRWPGLPRLSAGSSRQTEPITRRTPLRLETPHALYLFISCTKDPFAGRDLLERVVSKIDSNATVVWME